MENKSNRKRIVRKRVSTCLVAALFVVGLIGFCAFTPNSGAKATGKDAGLMSIADKWKTYSNSYLTFQYPDTYKISEEGKNGDSYELTCEIKGIDISMVQISVTDLEDADALTESIKDLSLTVGVTAAIEELKNNSFYKDFTNTEVKKVTKGCNTGFSSTYTASILGVPIQGECFMAFSGGRLLTLVAQAEDSKHMSELNQIVEGIRIK